MVFMWVLLACLMTSQCYFSHWKKPQELCLITAMTPDPFRTPNRSKAVLYTHHLIQHYRTLPGWPRDFRVICWGNADICITCKYDLEFYSSALLHIHINSTKLFKPVASLFIPSSQNSQEFSSENIIFLVSEIKEHTQTPPLIKKKNKQMYLEILKWVCWQGSTDPRSEFLMFGRIFLLPPRFNSSFFLYTEDTLLRNLSLMCNANLGGVDFCVLLACASLFPC